MTSTDSGRLSAIWPQLRGASDARARNQLVDQAITAVAALQMDLSRARHAAALAYDLGRTLMRGVERGRKLHPWQGRRHSMDALVSEVDELRVAVVSRNEDSIRAEAIDVCVVALRIMMGR